MNFSQNGTKPIATETIDECLLRLHNPYVAQYEIIRGKEKSAGGVCGLAFFALYICPIIIGIWRWLSISGSFTQGLISAAITAACLLTIAGIISKAEKRYRLEANSIFGKWEREAIDVITNHRKKFGGFVKRINGQLIVVNQHYSLGYFCAFHNFAGGLIKDFYLRNRKAIDEKMESDPDILQ